MPDHDPTPRNRLSEQRSPYLRQHADNPVHWRPWGPDALAEAAASKRPILLSIGYAACHWCHVMAHESFEDPSTAALMNSDFVNIKVDREERPDVDHLYMTALQAMGQRGGWPLTMFLRPDGMPFWGGTYFPPESRYGQPSFRDVLRAISLAWKEGGALIDDNAARLGEMLVAGSHASSGAWPDAELRSGVVYRLLASTDKQRGGLSGAPKFPNAPLFRYLWQQRDRNLQTGEAVHHLLRAMIDGGIHDQIGGGFARYSTDAEWLVPHFEKMLCDNGQILELLAYAAADRSEPAYERSAALMVAWLQREMRVDGAFAAALDADSERDEGRFYVWHAPEIADALAPLGTQRAMQWQRAFDVTDRGNWEGKTILRRVGPVDEGLATEGAALLLSRREGRARPGRDDKVLADWNALTVIGLVRAAGVFDRAEWAGLADSVWTNVEQLLRGPDGRLSHAACDGQITASGLLDDQAAGALAVLALWEVNGERRWLDRAIELCELVERWFRNAQGNYVQTPADASDLPRLDGVDIHPRPTHDSASPSGLSMLAEAQARLAHFTGEERWRAAAEATIRSTVSAEPMYLAQQPGILFAAHLLEQARTMVVDGPEAETWIATARAWGDPDLLVMRGGAERDIPPSHPVYGRRATGGRTVGWVCAAGRCSLPMHDIDALAGAAKG